MLVTALLKWLNMESRSASSSTNVARGANLLPIVAWKALITVGSFSFSRSNLMLGWVGSSELASNVGRESPGLPLRSLIFVPEGAENYREIKRKIGAEMKMTKETWIQGQCQEVEACLKKNNSKTAYHLVKDLTTEKR